MTKQAAQETLFSLLEEQCMQLMGANLAPTYVLLGAAECEILDVPAAGLSLESQPVLDVAGIELVVFPALYLDSFLSVVADAAVMDVEQFIEQIANGVDPDVMDRAAQTAFDLVSEAAAEQGFAASLEGVPPFLPYDPSGLLVKVVPGPDPSRRRPRRQYPLSSRFGMPPVGIA